MGKAEENPWSSVGRVDFKDKIVPARVLSADDAALWPAALKDETRMKLVLIRSRNTVLYAEGQGCAVIAPSALFLHQNGSFRLDGAGPGPGDRLILFHPRYIFDTLTFQNDFITEDEPAYNYDGYLLSRFAAHKTPAERVLFLEPVLSRYLGDTIDRTRGELDGQADGYWPCRGRSFLLQALIACAHLSEGRPESAVPPETMSAGEDIAPLFAFLVARLSEKISVDRIAREFGTNRTSLQEKMRRATGMSVTQYLIRLRVQTASILLRNTGITIAEIMARTGFADETHFCRLFKKYAGRSPAEFRKAFVFPEYLKESVR